MSILNLRSWMSPTGDRMSNRRNDNNDPGHSGTRLRHRHATGSQGIADRAEGGPGCVAVVALAHSIQVLVEAVGLRGGRGYVGKLRILSDTGNSSSTQSGDHIGQGNTEGEKIIVLAISIEIGPGGDGRIDGGVVR